MASAEREPIFWGTVGLAPVGSRDKVSGRGQGAKLPLKPTKFHQFRH
jgi:hypothetical protein